MQSTHGGNTSTRKDDNPTSNQSTHRNNRPSEETNFNVMGNATNHHSTQAFLSTAQDFEGSAEHFNMNPIDHNDAMTANMQHVNPTNLEIQGAVPQNAPAGHSDQAWASLPEFEFFEFYDFGSNPNPNGVDHKTTGAGRTKDANDTLTTYNGPAINTNIDPFCGFNFTFNVGQNDGNPMNNVGIHQAPQYPATDSGAIAGQPAEGTRAVQWNSTGAFTTFPGSNQAPLNTNIGNVETSCINPANLNLNNADNANSSAFSTTLDPWTQAIDSDPMSSPVLDPALVLGGEIHNAINGPLSSTTLGLTSSGQNSASTAVSGNSVSSQQIPQSTEHQTETAPTSFPVHRPVQGNELPAAATQPINSSKGKQKQKRKLSASLAAQTQQGNLKKHNAAAETSQNAVQSSLAGDAGALAQFNRMEVGQAGPSSLRLEQVWDRQAHFNPLAQIHEHERQVLTSIEQHHHFNEEHVQSSQFNQAVHLNQADHGAHDMERSASNTNSGSDQSDNWEATFKGLKGCPPLAKEVRKHERRQPLKQPVPKKFQQHTPSSYDMSKRGAKKGNNNAQPQPAGQYGPSPEATLGLNTEPQFWLKNQQARKDPAKKLRNLAPQPTKTSTTLVEDGTSLPNGGQRKTSKSPRKRGAPSKYTVPGSTTFLLTGQDIVPVIEHAPAAQGPPQRKSRQRADIAPQPVSAAPLNQAQQAHPAQSVLQPPVHFASQPVPAAPLNQAQQAHPAQSALQPPVHFASQTATGTINQESESQPLSPPMTRAELERDMEELRKSNRRLRKRICDLENQDDEDRGESIPADDPLRVATRCNLAEWRSMLAINGEKLDKFGQALKHTKA